MPGPPSKWLRRCVECRYADRTDVYVEPPYSPSDQACPVCGGVVFEAVSSEDLDKPDEPDEWWQGRDLNLVGSRSHWWQGQPGRWWWLLRWRLLRKRRTLQTGDEPDGGDAWI